MALQSEYQSASHGKTLRILLIITWHFITNITRYYVAFPSEYYAALHGISV